MSTKKQSCYIPTGLRTRKDSSNLNMTVNQHKKARNISHSGLSMGEKVDWKAFKDESMLESSWFRATLTTIKEEFIFFVYGTKVPVSVYHPTEITLSPTTYPQKWWSLQIT